MYDTQKAHYITVTVILYYKDKYLLLKRSNKEKAFPNQWSVPGGKLEANDYLKRKKDTSDHWYNIFEIVAIRETQEETQIKIEKPQYLCSMVYIRSDNIPAIIVSMHAESKTQEVTLHEEHTEYAWVTFDELKKYELVPGIHEEFVMIEELRGGKEKKIWEKY